MRLRLAVLVAAFVVPACGSGGSSPGAGGEADEQALSNDGKSAAKVIDACTQAAIGATAADAFVGNNLQHLTDMSVDGAPGVQEGKLTYRVTTSNDEDGATERTVVVDAKGSACKVTSIVPLDGNMPSASDARSAYKAVVDTCTMVAIDRAAKKALLDNDLQHLHGLSLTDGDPAEEGALTYAVRLGNDEDGDTDYTVVVAQKINFSTGKSSCTVTRIDAKR